MVERPSAAAVPRDGGRRRRPSAARRTLSEDERRIERLFLGLRVADGLPLAEIDPLRAEPLVAAGLARTRDGRLSLTERGLYMANDAVLALTD